MRRSAKLLALILAAACVLPLAFRGTASSVQAQDDTPSAARLQAQDMELVEVNWIDEMKEGGLTMVALAFLSIAGLTMIIERAIVIRRKRFAPPDLLDKAIALVRKGDLAGADALCKENHSVLAGAVRFVLEHRNNDMEKVVDAAVDLAGRGITDQEQRTYPLAAVAALAPLLGLLGTMIGMIESFKLVEVFGDEGGASMLAGSISKALITTAVGLIIAIPTLAAYHFFRQRIHAHAMRLEHDVQTLINTLYLKRAPLPSKPIEKPEKTRPRRSPDKPREKDAA